MSSPTKLVMGEEDSLPHEAAKGYKLSVGTRVFRYPGLMAQLYIILPHYVPLFELSR
jgi:hypothetical protein